MKIKILIAILLISFNLKAQNDGTKSGTASWAADVPSSHSADTNSILFGSAGKASTTSDILLPASGSSLSVWFKKTGSGDQILFSHTGFSGYVYIRIENSTTISFNGNAGGYKPFTVPTMSLNTWYNLIIVRNAGTSHLFLNGTESTTGGLTATQDININQLGGYYTMVSPFDAYNYTGNLVELRIFDTSITSTDISNLAAGSAPITSSILYWKMNEGSGNTLSDLQGGGGSGGGPGGGTTGSDSNWVRSGNNIYFNNGKVGIGTTTPQEKLSVNGTVLATKVKVSIDTADWADFVFDKNYKIPSLEETEKYINLHKHLPGIPSANEVGKNGLDLGVNQALLLQKIEELTLLIIQQNKRIQVLEKNSHQK